VTREALYTVGLDLGQARDWTALAVLETQLWFSGAVLRDYPWAGVAEGWNSPAGLDQHAIEHVLTRDDSRWPGKPPLALKYLERMRDVPYPDVVAHVKALVERPPLAGNCMLVVDSTGVGKPIVDMFRQAGLRPVAVSIHGGDSVGHTGPFDWRCPKRDLVASVQSTLQTRRLQVLASLPLADVLVKELGNFRVTINPATSHDSYSSWREQDHDDLVLAVSLATWWRDHYWRNFDRARLTRGGAVTDERANAR